jgi:hypothetical protein
MPKGPGTYGSKRGRPPKKNKAKAKPKSKMKSHGRGHKCK